MKTFLTVLAAIALAACGASSGTSKIDTGKTDTGTEATGPSVQAVVPNPQTVAAGCTVPTEAGPAIKITGSNGTYQLPNTGKKYEVIVTGLNVEATVMPCAYITLLKVAGSNGEYIFSPTSAVENILITSSNNDLRIPAVSTAIVYDASSNNSVTRSE